MPEWKTDRFHNRGRCGFDDIQANSSLGIMSTDKCTSCNNARPFANCLLGDCTTRRLQAKLQAARFLNLKLSTQQKKTPPAEFPGASATVIAALPFLITAAASSLVVHVSNGALSGSRQSQASLPSEGSVTAEHSALVKNTLSPFLAPGKRQSKSSVLLHCKLRRPVKVICVCFLALADASTFADHRQNLEQVVSPNP